jgi:hypothetical protein
MSKSHRGIAGSNANQLLYQMMLQRWNELSASSLKASPEYFVNELTGVVRNWLGTEVVIKALAEEINKPL